MDLHVHSSISTYYKQQAKQASKIEIHWKHAFLVRRSIASNSSSFCYNFDFDMEVLNALLRTSPLDLDLAM